MCSLVRVLGAACFLFGLLPTAGHSQQGPEPPDLAYETALSPPDVDGLRAEIADKLAKLNLPSHPAETPSVKAAQVRKAIEQGDFTTARRIIAAVLSGSKLQPWRFYPFRPFFTDIPDVRAAVFGKSMDDWVAHAAGDAIPLLLRAQYYYSAAWDRRGPYFISVTSADNLAAFDAGMTRALKDIDAAIKLDHSNPYAYRLKLSILSDMGKSDEAKKWFEGSIAAYPNYFTLYLSMLGAITPKWGGSTAGMYRFVDYYAGAAPDDSPLKMLYLALYDYLLDDAGITCSGDANRDSDILAPCIAVHMKKAVTPRLEGQVQKALQLYGHYDHQEYNLILRSLLGDMLQRKGGETFAEAILAQAAAATHSNTEMATKDGDHNDYAIDELVATTWQYKLEIDNSIAKLKQALHDLDLDNFSDAGDKFDEMAYIYNQLAAFSEVKSKYLYRMRQRANIDDRYVDMIVYATAAARLSKSPNNEHLACYGYAQLQLYEDAIRSCSEVLENDDNIQAHYWRGVAYRHTNQLPAALKDLGLVADSGDRERSVGAAIQMSYIYLGMKDYKSLLDVLNEHRELFNPMWAEFAYETRCRARMELGDLQKALEDCTAAMQIGGTPQAQRLQQELIGRLAQQKSTGAVPSAQPQPPDRNPQPATAQPAPPRPQNGYPHLSRAVIVDIKDKIEKAGFEPNGVAIVYDLKDWHQHFPEKHPYAKMLDLPMTSLKEAVEVMVHYATGGLGFAVKWDRPPRFRVVLVDDQVRSPDDRALDKHTWGILGISMVQCRSLAEIQKTMKEAAPDVVLISEKLPETMKSDVRAQTGNVPALTVPIPLLPGSGQPAMSDAMSGQTPEKQAYEQALLDYEQTVFDALQKTVPADQHIYVSFVTM